MNTQHIQRTPGICEILETWFSLDLRGHVVFQGLLLQGLLSLMRSPATVRHTATCVEILTPKNKKHMVVSKWPF